MAMFDPKLIEPTHETSKLLFADDLGTDDKNIISEIFKDYNLEDFFPKPNQRIYGYLLFKDHESAQRALQEKNYTSINNKIVHLYWADEQTRKLKYDRANTIILKGIESNIDIKNLHQTLQNVGEVINVTISSKPQGTNAYVQFRDAESAQKLINASPITINNKPIPVEKYQNHHQEQVTTNEDTYTKIYLNNLPESYTTDEKLKELIGDRGTVTDVNLVGKQAATVILTTHEEAKRCVEQLNDTEVDGKKIIVQRALTRSEFNQRHNRGGRGAQSYGGPPRNVRGGRGGYQPRLGPTERKVQQQPVSMK